MASRDDNDFPVIYGVSHLDGKTPVRINFNPSGRGMKVDKTTTIGFNPAIISNQTNNDNPIAKGTSTANNKTALPWVVNATTGAVLISM